jgi:hypothetical protein
VVTFPIVPHLRRLALVICLGALALSGCGDDSVEEVEDGATSTTVAQTDPADETEDESDDGSDAEPDGGGLPDACGLLDADEVEALIGPATAEADGGTTIDMLNFDECIFEADEGRGIVGVAITSSRSRYDMHVERLDGEAVDGLGDEAFMAVGMSLETKGATGGRTVSMLVDGRTVVVALRIEGDTPPEVARTLAESVLTRLG